MHYHQPLPMPSTKPLLFSSSSNHKYHRLKIQIPPPPVVAVVPPLQTIQAIGRLRELYLWAASMFASRSFPDSLLKWGCPVATLLLLLQVPTHNSEDANVQLQNMESTDSKLALFPLLNILNHKSRTKIRWQSEELYWRRIA